jgi:hypothetical protein
MNKRIRLTFIFSSPNFPYQQALGWLSPKLTSLFCGACLQEIDGAWSSDGHHNKASYQAGEQEKGMKILLSVTPDKQDFARQQVQQLLQKLKNQLCLSFCWIHVEQEEVTAHHFQLL